MTPIFYIKDGDLNFADKMVLSNIELYISSGDKICLVGRNGCGKSSLMKVINGEYELDKGELFKDSVINIGYLKQDVSTSNNSTIYDFLLKGHGSLEDRKYQADIFLEQLDIDGNMKLSSCSGGQIRRAYLARSLLNKPDILLLDEPTNHLDIKAICWLEDYIKNYTGAVVCISHDRIFQENITNKVWWLDRGILRKSSKGFKHYDQWREEIIASEEAALRKMNRKLEAEKNWLNTGVTARRKRNQKRLANLHRLRESFRSYHSHLKSAKSKLQIELSKEVKKTKFIIEAESVSYNFEDKKLFDDFTFKVKKGEKIGMIGSNGSGKSTLLRILAKEIIPKSGRVKHGTNLEITYFDQHRSALDPKHTLKQVLCPTGSNEIFLKDRSMHVAAYLKKFMFDPKILNDKVSTLSGGEASRLLLAKSLINPGNFFILDEPTNDLDMDSLEMLLEALADYTGTLIVVSHDRDFLERLVTRTLIFANEEIIDLYGGYEDYLKYSKQVAKTKSTKQKVDNVKVSKSTPAKPQNKLSYKYARLLEILPLEIKKLEQEILDIESQLEEGDLYNSDINKFNKLSNRLQKSKEELENKMKQWIEIEDMCDS